MVGRLGRGLVFAGFLAFAGNGATHLWLRGSSDSLSCPWSRSEWQFMVCDGWSPEASFRRR